MMRRFTSELGARLEVEIDHILGVLRAVAVADAVEAREVRRRLGRRDDVIGVEAVLGVGQRDLFDFTALLFVERNGALHCGADLGIEARAEIFLRNAETPRTLALLQFGAVIGNLGLE